MADDISITIDASGTRAAFKALSDALKPFIKVAARESANNVAREQRARLQRQLSGTSTGRTVEGITVKSDRTGWGWVVQSGPRPSFWLEEGTVKMEARPFFDSAAKLEEGAHQRRIQAAVKAAIHEHGLGDG
jgi:hypothetical protein